MMDRRRLIPAVILGAGGLLALKLISWAGGGAPWTNLTPLRDQIVRPGAVVGPDGAYDVDDYRGFTRIIAKAREPYIIKAPDVTGSVTKPPEDDKGAEAQPPERRNYADAFNSGERQPSPAERALTERLAERRDEIASRQRELELREKLLAAAERKLDSRVGELKAMEEQAQKDGPDGPDGKVIRNLVIMYENMKPKDAARVFDRLSIEVLLPMVLQMNPRKMSEVMAAMSPEAAEKLTVALAVRASAAAAGPRPAVRPAALPPNELPAIAPAPPRN